MQPITPTESFKTLGQWAIPAPKWLQRIAWNRETAGYALAVCITMFSIMYRFGYTYRDTPDRWTMRASLDHPLLHGIYTTPSRARVMQELLDQLRPLVRPDDLLLAHQELPMLHFLTQTRPYLYCTWPNFFQPRVFREVLARAQKEHPYLPICVLNNVNTSHPKWPDETYPPVTSRRFIENEQAIETFLSTKHYIKGWENKAFSVWLPPVYQTNAVANLSPVPVTMTRLHPQ